MKNSTITITEKLSKPYEGKVHDFDIGDNKPVPVFGEVSIETLREFAALAHELLNKEPLVVFWGLSGGLGNFYSKVPDTSFTVETLTVKITVAKTMQPFTVYREPAFELLVEKIGGIKALRSIPFEEAMLVVEGKKEPPAAKYEEPDEEDVEFDEDCLPTCLPGKHKCGKK